MRRLVDAVARAIARADVGGRVLVSSFEPAALRLWRRRMPSVPCGWLFERGVGGAIRRAWSLAWLRPASVHPEGALCTAAALRRWHRRGYQVNAWTVDDPAELRRLRDLGVDGLITNDPARARRALQLG
jgi:glycerophosphoryl diester phosphodiesterase